MNAPVPPDAIAVARLPLADICRSPTNPRKRIDEAYLDELAKTIKEHGVIQPITVRPNPKATPLYEIVVGECRWRASQRAGLTEIPAFWRDLDDKQVLEIQVIENLQRRDVHPLEEAEGYEALMKHHGYTADSLADKVGKSKAYIYARLKLTACGKAARDAFYAGDLDASRALLIARIPGDKLQAEALQKILKGQWGNDGPMSYRTALEYVQKHYMLNLAQAPFSRDDATLVPGAGTCRACPKRTGNQKDLFTDVKSADVCTDPSCYEAKSTVHIKLQREAAKAAGQKVIVGKEAEKIAPYGVGSDLREGYINLDRTNYEDPKHRTYRQILGKDAPAPTLLVDPRDKNKHIEVLPKTTIAQHLKAKGIALPSTRTSKSPAAIAAEKKTKLEIQYRAELFDAIRSALTIKYDAQDKAELSPEDMGLVALTLFQHTGHDTQKRLLRLWVGPPEKKGEEYKQIHEFSERIHLMTPKEQCRLLIELSVIGEAVSSYGEPDEMLAVAKRLKIDAETIKQSVADVAKAKEKPKGKKPKKSTAPAAKPVGKAPDARRAAQAQGQSAPEPAAPAKAKAAKAAKSPKAKTTPAPAAPSNEPAAGVETSASEGTAPVKTEQRQAWPFPTASRPRA